MNLSTKCNTCLHKEVCNKKETYEAYRNRMINVTEDVMFDSYHFSISIKCGYHEPLRQATRGDKP